MCLSAKVSPKQDYSPPAYLIGGIVTNTLKDCPKTLQVALGVITIKFWAVISFYHIVYERCVHFSRPCTRNRYCRKTFWRQDVFNC